MRNPRGQKARSFVAVGSRHGANLRCNAIGSIREIMEREAADPIAGSRKSIAEVVESSITKAIACA
jgi:hypothetical protein